MIHDGMTCFGVQGDSPHRSVFILEMQSDSLIPPQEAQDTQMEAAQQCCPFTGAWYPSGLVEFSLPELDTNQEVSI